MDFNPVGKHGVRGAQLLMGSAQDKVHVLANHQMQSSGVFSDQCEYPDRCDVEDVFTFGSSKTEKLVQNSEGKTDGANLNHKDGLGVTPTRFMGAAYEDNAVVQYREFGRGTQISSRWLSIADVNATLSSDLQGLVGLGPQAGANPTETDNRELKDNFLWQLHKQGKIDHMVFSYYIKDSFSHLKLGSYDPAALKPGSTFKMHKTLGIATWDLPL